MTNFNCLDGHKIKVSIAFVFVSGFSWEIESTRKSYTEEMLIPGLFTKKWESKGRNDVWGGPRVAATEGTLTTIGPEGKVQGIVPAESGGKAGAKE